MRKGIRVPLGEGVGPICDMPAEKIGPIAQRMFAYSHQWQKLNCQ